MQRAKRNSRLNQFVHRHAMRALPHVRLRARITHQSSAWTVHRPVTGLSRIHQKGQQTDSQHHHSSRCADTVVVNRLALHPAHHQLKRVCMPPMLHGSLCSNPSRRKPLASLFFCPWCSDSHWRASYKRISEEEEKVQSVSVSLASVSESSLVDAICIPSSSLHCGLKTCHRYRETLRRSYRIRASGLCLTLFRNTFLISYRPPTQYRQQA